MAKKRARLNDSNDPLNLTDKVLAGFEEVSQSTSQQSKKLTTPEPNNLTTQKPSNLTIQEPNNLTTQEPNKLTSSESGSPVSSTHEQIVQPNTSTRKSNTQEASKSNSQLVSKSSLRKSTFQISVEVLNQLEQLHLQLQLELGKANAPYKEVIVEEAIVQLLKQANSKRASLIKTLIKRHQQRSR